ncbi:hypothetical protein C8R46DRAFT_1351691 [Mycena filopes]|nr:hypothetical protein C8R46DRAFT_1351691 [Mycena filopes]
MSKTSRSPVLADILAAISPSSPTSVFTSAAGDSDSKTIESYQRFLREATDVQLDQIVRSARHSLTCEYHEYMTPRGNAAGAFEVIYQDILSLQVLKALLGDALPQNAHKASIPQLFLLHTGRLKSLSTPSQFTNWFLATFGPLIKAGEDAFGSDKAAEGLEPPTKKPKLTSRYAESVELFDKIAVLHTSLLETLDAEQDAQRTTSIKTDSLSADASDGTVPASESLGAHIVAPTTNPTLANAPTAPQTIPLTTPATSIPIPGAPAAPQTTPTTTLTLVNSVLTAPQNTHTPTPTTSIPIPAAPTTSTLAPLQRSNSAMRQHEAPEAGHVKRVKAIFARTAPPSSPTFSPRLDPRPLKMPGAWPQSPKRLFSQATNN